MIRSFAYRIARGVVVVLAIALAACGAVVNDGNAGSGDGASYEAAVEAGTAETRDEEGDPIFACEPDSGPYSIGAGFSPWTLTKGLETSPSATLRWTGCSSPPVWIGNDDRLVTSFADPTAHAPVMEGPGFLPTVGALLPEPKGFPWFYGPGVTIYPPVLDAASFSPTVPLHDESATIAVFLANKTPDDPRCGALDGLKIWVAEHADLVATTHALPPPTEGVWFARYDVLEGVPAGETVHVSIAFPHCAVFANPMWQLPPLLAGHVHALQTTVGAVGAFP